MKKLSPLTRVHHTADFLDKFLPPDAGTTSVDAYAKQVFDRAWKKKFKGMTLHAVNMKAPWAFVLTDYRGLMSFSRLHRGWPSKLGSNTYALLGELHSGYRRIDGKKITVPINPRVEIFYRNHFHDVHYAGYISVREKNH